MANISFLIHLYIEVRIMIVSVRSVEMMMVPVSAGLTTNVQTKPWN